MTAKGKETLAPALAGIIVAAALWFVMFSPWTAPRISFWWTMTGSAIFLTAFASLFCKEWIKDVRIDLKATGSGIGVAAVLWGVFWAGGKVSCKLFDFARPQLDLIYDMKEGVSPALVAVLLLCVIGPAEEIFWRGFVQRRLMQRLGPDTGFLAATAAYSLIHIWSFNFMLVMAALVIGFLWGLLYRLRPGQLFPLILSHALWDVAAFVLLPFPF